RKGDAITGLPPVGQGASDEVVVFHAGTASAPGGAKSGVLTSGGRVLCVTALASSVKEAQQRAYEAAKAIHFDGAQYRKDIGFRAIKP
ncbi:MAG: phosphoribosylglycinamide synthetase C domain-containing protein, partial [Polaromonas sp.]|nr:phosphoribosylglycinamide synthetase C domain-containing protein [Polaromonas sp.]